MSSRRNLEIPNAVLKKKNSRPDRKYVQIFLQGGIIFLFGNRKYFPYWNRLCLKKEFHDKYVKPKRISIWRFYIYMYLLCILVKEQINQQTWANPLYTETWISFYKLTNDETFFRQAIHHPTCYSFHHPTCFGELLIHDRWFYFCEVYFFIFLTEQTLIIFFVSDNFDVIH